MTVTQTVDIPASRRVFLDLPQELPVGRANITVSIDEYAVMVAFDTEAKKWYAQNDDIPIALEGDSLDVLINRVKLAVPEMLEMNNKPSDKAKLSFKIEPQAVMA